MKRLVLSLIVLVLLGFGSCCSNEDHFCSSNHRKCIENDLYVCDEDNDSWFFVADCTKNYVECVQTEMIAHCE